MTDNPVRLARIVALIETTEVHGDGSKPNPVRTVKSYWTPKGELLFQKDDYLGEIDSASSNVSSESI